MQPSRAVRRGPGVRRPYVTAATVQGVEQPDRRRLDVRRERTASATSTLRMIWPVASATDVEAAYASALAAGNPDRTASVVTDGMILANVRQVAAGRTGVSDFGDLEPDDVFGTEPADPRTDRPQAPRVADGPRVRTGPMGPSRRTGTRRPDRHRRRAARLATPAGIKLLMSGANLYYPWADIASDAGLNVKVTDTNAGWERRARSSGGFPATPLGCMWHHAASSPSTSDEACVSLSGAGQPGQPGRERHPRPQRRLLAGRRWRLQLLRQGRAVDVLRGVCGQDAGNTTLANWEVNNDGVGGARGTCSSSTPTSSCPTPSTPTSATCLPTSSDTTTTPRTADRPRPRRVR